VAVKPEPAVALLESTAAVTRTVKPVQHPATTTLISGDSRALPPRRPRSHRKRPPRISIAPRTLSFVLPAPSQAAENVNAPCPYQVGIVVVHRQDRCAALWKVD
jgi:hypothetical protein